MGDPDQRQAVEQLTQQWSDILEIGRVVGRKEMTAAIGELSERWTQTSSRSSP